MNAMTATDRGDLAEAMLPVAANLTVLVHGDGGPEDVQEVLAGLDDAQRNALIVVLAGLVDPDRPLGALLGWLDANEHGQQIVPDWDNADTLRAVADQVQPDSDDWDGVDRVAVDRWLHGLPVSLTRAERVEAILEGFRRGMGYQDLDDLAGVKAGSTGTFIRRERKAALERGDDFPDHLLPTTAPKLSESEVVAIRERSAAGASDLEISMSLDLTRKAVSAIVSGSSYRRFGGPIRRKRPNKPNEATRVHWANSTPGFAAAS